MALLNQYERFLNGLPAAWERKRVSELGKVVGGGTPSRDVKAFWNGPLPWLTPGEVSDGKSKFLSDTRDTISHAGLSSSGANLLPPSSLMVTTRATLGARAINAVPMATNQGFRSIVFKKGESADFYFYLIEMMKSELKRRASGTVFLEISGGEFGRIQVPSPPADEKRAIATILGTLDTAIQKTEAIVEKLKQVKQGLPHDLLTRGIDVNGELRPLQSEAPHLYKQSTLGWVPKEWVPTTLDSLVAKDRPIVYGILMPGYGEDSGIPVIKVKDIVEGFINQSNLLLTTPAIDREYRRSRLQAGDLLFTIRGTVGRTAFVPPQLDAANITQDTARISLVESDSTFIREWLGACLARAFVNVHTIGVAVRGINLRDVRRIPILRPPLAEARGIGDRMRAAESRVYTEQARLAKLELVRKGIMEDLFSGRIPVTPALST